MDYKDQIDPELRDTARQVPFNRRIIPVGNLYQSAVSKLMKIPGDLTAKTIEIEGYQDKKYKTEIFTPADAKGPMPALIYVHGGAFCYKAAAYHKNLACIYAAKAKCKVFFPDYHLAPEYPYPAGLEDVRSLYRYVSERAEELGIRKDMIGLAGDSAGATIAALICNEYEKENLIKPCLQMLVYPLTDADMETRSMKEYTDTPFWNSSNQRQMWEFYFGDRYNEVFENGVLKEDVKKESLPMYSGLPARIPDTYIETAEFDCLHDEGILYGHRLQKAGANVEYNDTKRTFHGYDMALDAQIVKEAVKRRLSFLRRHFQGGIDRTGHTTCPKFEERL